MLKLLIDNCCWLIDCSPFHWSSSGIGNQLCGARIFCGHVFTMSCMSAVIVNWLDIFAVMFLFFSVFNPVFRVVLSAHVSRKFLIGKKWKGAQTRKQPHQNQVLFPLKCDRYESKFSSNFLIFNQPQI